MPGSPGGGVQAPGRTRLQQLQRPLLAGCQREHHMEHVDPWGGLHAGRCGRASREGRAGSRGAMPWAGRQQGQGRQGVGRPHGRAGFGHSRRHRRGLRCCRLHSRRRWHDALRHGRRSVKGPRCQGPCSDVSGLAGGSGAAWQACWRCCPPGHARAVKANRRGGQVCTRGAVSARAAGASCVLLPRGWPLRMLRLP